MPGPWARDAPSLFFERDFAAAMAALGPFENHPALAVAVSGGADSMALCLLADGWARAREGRVLALIVDHGLRASSADEARLAASWLSARGIGSEILAWKGDKPATAVQARARACRYRLLFDCCRKHGVLHLLVGHHLEDQGETLLLRAAGGSGTAGLAGMSSLVETGALRVLRPLLEVPRWKLRAYLESHGQDWIEDPSNADRAYARARLRAAPSASAAAAAPLLAAREGCRRRRECQDEAVADLLARYCRLHPLGFARLDPAILHDDDVEEAAIAAVLGRVAATVGGRSYPPATEDLARLQRRLRAEAPVAASLGRCLWRSQRCRGTAPSGSGSIVVAREARGFPEPTPLAPGSEVEWDGRFLVRASARAGEPDRVLTVAALTEAGRRQAARLLPEPATDPATVAAGLPAIYGPQGLLAVPSLGAWFEPALEGFVSASFRPRRSLSGPGYYLA